MKWQTWMILWIAGVIAFAVYFIRQFRIHEKFKTHSCFKCFKTGSILNYIGKKLNKSASNVDDDHAPNNLQASTNSAFNESSDVGSLRRSASEETISSRNSHSQIRRNLSLSTGFKWLSRERPHGLYYNSSIPDIPPPAYSSRKNNS